MGLLDKIILTFPQEWWGNKESFVFFWSKEDVDSIPLEDKWITEVTSASSPKASNNTLTLWTHGDTAKLVSSK